MNDDLPIKPSVPPTNAPITDEETGHVTGRVFDIVGDDIKPISENELVAPLATTVTRLGATSAESQKSSSVDMLDKNIGSFETAPFAPAQNSIATPIKQGQPLQTKTNAQPNISNRINPVVPPIKTISFSKPISPTIPRPIEKPTGKSLQEVATAALPSYLQDVKPTTPSVTLREVPAQPQITSESPNVTTDPAFQNNLKPIRTYEGDIAEIMARKKTSTASMVIAENKKQNGQEKISNNVETSPKESSHIAKKLLLLVVSLLLLGGGAYGAYYLYSKSPIAPVEPVAQRQRAMESIIPSERQSVVTLDSESPIRIQSQITEAVMAPQDLNTIKEIVVANKNGSSLNRVGTERMVDLMEIDAPDILTRSLTSDWMLGVYNNNQNEKGVFLVLTTNFFQNTFAGMLLWERVMADDIKGYLYPSDLEGISNTPIVPAPPINPLLDIDSILPVIETSTSTATSTGSTEEGVSGNQMVQTPTQEVATLTEIVKPLRPYFTIRGSFEDRIVKNKDVRAFRTTDGEIIFLYSFIDNKSLVITKNEATLEEIITRLEKQAFIR